MSEPAVTPPAPVIRRGAEFDGLVLLPASARIDGRISGDVIASGLVWIGEAARVKARIQAEEVVVAGVIEGEVLARQRIELLATARVSGALRAPRLVLADGAFLEGRCQTDSIDDEAYLCKTCAAQSPAGRLGVRSAGCPCAGIHHRREILGSRTRRAPARDSARQHAGGRKVGPGANRSTRQRAVRNLGHRIASLVATAIAATVLCTASASAAEGGLVLVPDWTTTLPALILLFALLIVPVNALIFKPVFRVLDARADKIAGTRKRAEKLARDADASLASYEQSVRAVRDDAARDRKQRLERARSDYAARTASARAEAEQEVLRARADVGAALDEARASLRAQAEGLAAEALDEARASLRAQAEGLAAEAAARILGRPLS
jgi:cytoskeletal protein CcmA (bactofilin family)/F0F1-type ATP synthase membrane subunit b/b'